MKASLLLSIVFLLPTGALLAHADEVPASLAPAAAPAPAAAAPQAIFGAFTLGHLDVGLRVASQQVYLYKGEWFKAAADQVSALPNIEHYSGPLTPEITQRMMVMFLARALLQETPSEFAMTRLLPQLEKSARMLTRKYKIGYVGYEGPDIATVDQLPRDPGSELFALRLCHPTLSAVQGLLGDQGDVQEYQNLQRALGETLAAAQAVPGTIEPFWSAFDSAPALLWRTHLAENPRTKPFIEMLMSLSRYLEHPRR